MSHETPEVPAAAGAEPVLEGTVLDTDVLTDRVEQVVAITEQVCGRPIRLEVGPRRAGDPAVLVGDSTRARRLLGWNPSRSDLRTQIADAWNWARKRDEVR